MKSEEDCYEVYQRVRSRETAWVHLERQELHISKPPAILKCELFIIIIKFFLFCEITSLCLLPKSLLHCRFLESFRRKRIKNAHSPQHAGGTEGR